MTAGTTPRVAYCGGGTYRKYLDSCVVWDSYNHRWDEHRMGPLPRKRRQPSVVTFENIGVYVIGGSGFWIRGVQQTKSTSDFLPANSLQWKRGPGLPKDVSDVSRGCAVPVSKNSFIYINTGSNDTYTGRSGVIREYMINMANPTSNQGWMSANRWPTLSSWHGHGCARIGRNVLIAGGFNGGYVNGKWRDYHGEKVRNTKIIDIATRQGKPSFKKM